MPLHERKLNRLKDFDYSSPGAYFVTLCLQHRHLERHHLAKLVENQSRPTEIGMLAEHSWNQIPVHYPAVTLDEFILMPDHLHGILWLGPNVPQPSPVGTQHRSVHHDNSTREHASVPIVPVGTEHRSCHSPNLVLAEKTCFCEG